METLVIHYEKSNRAARKLVEAVVASGVVTVERKRRTRLHLAMEEVQAGKTYPVKDPGNIVAEITGKDV